MSTRTGIARTAAGFHGIVTVNGRVVAMTLANRDRNAAVRAALALARSI